MMKLVLTLTLALGLSACSPGQHFLAEADVSAALSSPTKGVIFAELIKNDRSCASGTMIFSPAVGQGREQAMNFGEIRSTEQRGFATAIIPAGSYHLNRIQCSGSRYVEIYRNAEPDAGASGQGPQAIGHFTVKPGEAIYIGTVVVTPLFTRALILLDDHSAHVLRDVGVKYPALAGKVQSRLMTGMASNSRYSEALENIRGLLAAR